MKKLILLLTVLVLVAVTACGTNDNHKDNINEKPKPSPTPTCEEIIELVSAVDWEPLTLEQMSVRTDTIIVGRVNEVLPAVRINKIELGYETTLDREEWTNITRTKVEVLQSIKGELKEGESINVDQEGGFAECINEYIDGMPFLKQGSTYIFFLREPYGKDAQYCRYMTGIWQSFLEAADGRILKQDYSFFEAGLPIEEAVEQIKAVMIPIPPVNIPIEQAMHALSEFLTNYETELGFAPKRDLTGDELAKISDFEGDTRIVSVIGIKLENGRLILWVKTAQLNKGQQRSFEEELSHSIRLYADSLGVDYAVTVRQFDTLITIIGGGECRADIHNWFSDYIKREGI